MSNNELMIVFAFVWLGVLTVAVNFLLDRTHKIAMDMVDLYKHLNGMIEALNREREIARLQRQIDEQIKLGEVSEPEPPPSSRTLQ